jgi:hypothetical protein
MSRPTDKPPFLCAGLVVHKSRLNLELSGGASVLNIGVYSVELVSGSGTPALLPAVGSAAEFVNTGTLSINSAGYYDIVFYLSMNLVGPVNIEQGDLVLSADCTFRGPLTIADTNARILLTNPATEKVFMSSATVTGFGDPLFELQGLLTLGNKYVPFCAGCSSTRINNP